MTKPNRIVCLAAAALACVCLLAGCKAASNEAASERENTFDAILEPAIQIEDTLRVTPGTNPEDTREIVCWGDSLTYGTGATPEPVMTADGVYESDDMSTPAILGHFTGLTVYNFGIPGATSQDITDVQQGRIPQTLVGNYWIGDFGGEPEYDGRFDDFTDEDWAELCELYELGIDAELIEKANEHGGNILVLEIGSNGGWADYEELIAQYRSMIDYAGAGDYIIVGDTDDPGTSYGDPFQEPIYDEEHAQTTQWEDALAEEFGEHFLNTRLFLIEHGLKETNIVPDEDDEIDADNGCISQKLRSDWTHLNALGYYAKARAIFDKGCELGYWGAERENGLA